MLESVSSIVAFIFARGGSKGVPRKNLREINGIPLIGLAIRAGEAVQRISRIVLSTDDPEIAEVGRRFGAEVPFLRPTELASDSSREWDAWRHAIRWVQTHDGRDAIDVFVSIPATAPLRKSGDIDRCLDAFLSPPEADIVITTTHANANPYFNMVCPTSDGLVRLAANDGFRPFRRQDAPKVMNITCVAYVTRPSFVLANQGIFDGRVKGVEVDPISAIDIDSELDFKIATLLAQNRDNSK